MAAKLAIMTHSRALKNNFYTRYSSYKRSALCFHVVQFGTSPAQFPIKSKKKKKKKKRERDCFSSFFSLVSYRSNAVGGSSIKYMPIKIRFHYHNSFDNGIEVRLHQLTALFYHIQLIICHLSLVDI